MKNISRENDDGTLDALMQEGYDLVDKEHDVAGCALWLKVWDELKIRFTPQMNTIEEAEAVFEGNEFLFNWVQDLEIALDNAAQAGGDAENKAFHNKRIHFCREFIEFFPKSHNIVQHMKLAIADSLLHLDKREEAEQVYQWVVAKYPKYPWGYIHWGDFHAGTDPRKAEEFYRKALGMDPAENELVQDRIRDLKNKKK